MRSALESYATYFKGPDREALGRFVLPVSRLEELETAGQDLFPRGSDAEPWRVAGLVSGDVAAAIEVVLRFNRNHSSGGASGRALIDVVELKAATVEDIERQASQVPQSFTAYFEVPLGPTCPALLTTVNAVRARAKVRTGGVTPDVFPASSELMEFMDACRRDGVAFKATAGLHHPVRGSYRLTYERGSSAAMMYGFLNVFIAAALLYAGNSKEIARGALEETDVERFSFDHNAIGWSTHRVSTEEVRKARDHFAISFGSCSFREPVEELAEMVR
ncbi:MAG: hypothetical protein ABR585_01440 [Gemmatimonadaceae bacterium]